MPQAIREEFRLKNIFPSHNDYVSFTTSKWMHPTFYLVYRWLVAIFMSISLILDRLYFNRWYSSAFTMWGLVTITLYFDLSALLCSILHYSRNSSRSNSVAMTTKEDSGDGDAPCDLGNQLEIVGRTNVPSKIIWLLKLMWVLFNIAAVNSLIVTIGYWGLLHRAFGHKSLIGRLGYHNITAHLLNSLLMLLDAMLVAFPVRLLHLVYSNIYGVIYILATLIHWLASEKTKIFYSFLDYTNKPGLAGIIIFLCFFVVQPLVQLFYYFLYRFREWLLPKFSRRYNHHIQYIA